MGIEVLKPGAMTSFQDLGRHGSQHLGAPVCGAMDEVSHCLANAAVGNPAGAATLEITLMGPALRFGVDAVVAWAGADLSPVLDGTAIEARTPTPVRAGQILQFGKRRCGIRSYLAVRGGYDIAPVLGSRSTYLRGGFGGKDGRMLRSGDQIGLAQASHGPAALRTPDAGPLPGEFDPLCSTGAIRVIAGREHDFFSPEALAQFASEPWKVTPQSDRMGYRLSGQPLVRCVEREILSVPIPLGTVQVPPDGQPIVLMADRQTLGGYPKIATVATVDIPRMAQRGPGDLVRFEFVELATAQAALLERARWLDGIFSHAAGKPDGGWPPAHIQQGDRA